MKSPMFVRKETTASGPAFFLRVGRMIEQAGRAALMKSHGSGMIKFVEKASPPNGGEFRSGKVTGGAVGSVKGAKGADTALPAVSCQV